MFKTFKFRLCPTSSQRTKLNKSIDKCCEVYNKLLDIKINKYKEENINIDLYKLQKELVNFKKEDKNIKL